MKKVISLVCCVGLILSSVMLVFPALAVENTSIEEFAEDMSELYAEEEAEGKELEESVVCRVMVKATVQPDTYKNAECVVGNNNRYIYQYSDAETAQKAVEYYNSLPFVKWAELDGIVESQAVSYGNYMMQGDEAKEFAVSSNVTTNEVVVAVLDTGAHFQREYLNNRVIDSGYNLSNSGTEGSAKADNIHGTYVSSIIIDNTSENVKVVAYKVMNRNGIGSHSSIALGIELAVDDGADVINMSLGSDEYSNAIHDAIKYAYSKGVIVVCAAGNDGGDVSKQYPAAFDEVFTVGSIDSKGHYSIFSNHGEEVDFVAPGHNLELPDLEKDYGTSFSTPFVSSAAAMVLAVNPDLTINQVKNILIESAVPYEDLSYYDGFHIMYGYEGEEYWDLYEAFVEEIIDDESLYYGYGMPQTQNAVGIALGYEEAIKPEFSVESGTYNDEFEVTISAPEGYEIYYTTDETYPAKDSATLYSAPIKIAETQSIRAVAYSPNGMRSLHNTAEYRVLFYATENDFTIDFDGYLTSYTGSLTELIVPETINGITVTGIREYAIYNDDIRSIVLPKTLTQIEECGLFVDNAIYISAKGLKTVYEDGIWSGSVVEFVAPSLEKIECMTLGNVKTLYFPQLKEIGEYGFYGSGAKEIYLPLITEVPFKAFSQCSFLRKVCLPSVTSVDCGAFSECSWLKVVDIPNLKEFASKKGIDIVQPAFYKCLNLVEVNFPNVEKIEGERLFQRCENLEKVSLPKAQSICKETFLECYRLSDIYIPNVQVIEDYAFSGTASLAELELPNAIELGDGVFRNSSLKTLDAPMLETIGKYGFAFYDDFYDRYIANNSIDSINVPNLEAASDYAFAYTGALTKLKLPSLTDLGENAFLESSVSYLDAPMLKNTSSMPTVENSIVILSSEFSECSLDANGYSLTIYSTPNTYAQTYAEQYGLTFINAPVIINDLPAEYFEGDLTVDVAGFNKIYRWFGTNNENGTGVKLLSTSTTEKEFDPSEHNYKYYFSIVISRDNGYNRSVKTSLCQNMLYSTTPSSDARITIATPSERTIRYGESIKLYAYATGLPEGAKIKWRIVEGNGVKLDPSSSGTTCTVTSKSNGNVTIEAYAVDKNGNSIVNKKGIRVYDREGITSEVSLWWIILYYIRQMFSTLNIVTAIR